MSQLSDPHTSFPFFRLPIELRLKIWRFTFLPRIVDIWVLKNQPSEYHVAIGARPVRCIHFHPPRELTQDGIESAFIRPSRRAPVLEICHESRAWALENGIVSLSAEILLLGNISEWITHDTQMAIVVNKNHQETKSQRIFEALRKEPSPRGAIDLKHDTISLGMHPEQGPVPWNMRGRLLSRFSIPRLSVLLKRLNPGLVSKIRFLAVDIHVLTQKNGTDLAWLLVLKELQNLTINDTDIGVTALRPGRKTMQSILKEDLETLIAETPNWRPRWKFVYIKRTNQCSKHKMEDVSLFPWSTLRSDESYLQIVTDLPNTDS